MKLTIFYKREYDFVGSDGARVQGCIYAGYPEKGRPIKFSSRDTEKEFHPVMKYEPDLAVDVDIVIGFDEVRGVAKFTEK